MDPQIFSDMDALARDKKKLHVIFIPCPGQSHIKAMLKLAELLHHKGIHITFVNTDSVHKRFLESGRPHCLDASPPGFRFETIPDGISFGSLDDVATARNKRIHSIENLLSTPFLVDDVATARNPGHALLDARGLWLHGHLPDEVSHRERACAT